MIDSFWGTHAREWITPAAATYIIKQLIETKEEALKNLDWYIMPNMNPDGYAYSQKEVSSSKFLDFWGFNVKPTSTVVMSACVHFGLEWREELIFECW